MAKQGNPATATLLIIDDNAMNSDILSRRLSREGYDVLVESSGRGGLDVLAQRHVDLILLDILMPGMDGYEVLRILKEDPRTQTIPVIMLTAVHEIESVIRCLELGVDDYLTKPFNIPFVKSRIAAVLHGRSDRQGEGQEAGPGPKRRLLIIDDNPMNRDMLSRRLEREGYEVLTADGGREGLDLIANHEIDLVLLDILMPGMDGYQVLRAMKEDGATRHLPVIMLTAVSDVESVKRCIDLGADDYLIKPFNSVLLKSRIAAVIADHERE
jgi:DNA-binding response OmpR family regulator